MPAKRSGLPADARPVPDFPGYFVSSDGRVFSTNRWRGSSEPRELARAYDVNDYPRVTLCADGNRRLVQVHILVCEVFYGPKPAGMQVRHLDGNRRNSAASNLAYGTKSENERDKLRHGTQPNARKTHCSAGHPFAEWNTRVSSDGRRRACKTCERGHSRRRQQRLAA